MSTHLDDKVADDAAVANVHSRAKRVEDAHNAHLHAALLLVGVTHCLCNALAFVVACARAIGVDVAKVRFRLRVDLFGGEEGEER